MSNRRDGAASRIDGISVKHPLSAWHQPRVESAAIVERQCPILGLAMLFCDPQAFEAKFAGVGRELNRYLLASKQACLQIVGNVRRHVLKIAPWAE